jgi:signal transduction histidine kinase
MTRFGDRVAAGIVRWHDRWPALLLPLLAVAVYGLFHTWPCGWLVLLTVAMAAFLPAVTAKLAPFALFAYGAYGLVLAHALSLWEVLLDGYGPGYPLLARLAGAFNWGGLPAYDGQVHKVLYGVVLVGPDDNAAYVLPQALVVLAAAVWLLAVTGAPGGRAVKNAVAQLRGAGGQPKTVPPLLLLPVIFLWEELLSQRLWFGWFIVPSKAGLIFSVLAFAVGILVVLWLPRVAAVAAVFGTALLGLCGVAIGLRLSLPASVPGSWFAALLYGAVPLQGKFYSELAPDHLLHPSASFGEIVLAGQNGPLVLVLTAVQGAALLAAACLLAGRLPAWAGDFGLDCAGGFGLDWANDTELTVHARELTKRVTRLTQTRSDATETAAAELRRIERDLHDGAQARLVAVGMALRAAEQLMPANPDAAMALVAEARQTSSRALDDIRDLVRGIYPPVLADRGLADAVRALALDSPLTVHTELDLRAEPPMPVAAAVYFAVAEALTNAARHAAADAVEVVLADDDDLLRATVTDDGYGGADPAAGTGLAGVERRLATFDGILAVNSPPGGPTIIAIEVPYVPVRGGLAGSARGSLADVVRSSWQTRTLL